MTVSEYLRQAWEVNSGYEPSAHRGPYRTPMWEFVRLAKALSSLGGLDEFQALAEVEKCLSSWLNSAEHDDVWKALFPNSDDPREEFIYTWNRIKWPKAELERAQADANAFPLKPRRCYSPGYGRFISIAGHLQKGVKGPILLPCVKLSEMLNCAPMAISRYRDWAQRDGLLKMTSRGTRAQRKADEFSFVVELFDWKTGEEMLNRDSENKEKERKEEIQEKQEKEEIKEKQRETRESPPVEKKKCSVRSGPYIPTSAELAEQLRKTAPFRKSR